MFTKALLRLKIATLLAVAGTIALSGSAVAQRYVQTNLVSDVPGWANTLDPNLVNAWGIDFSSQSPVWIADNGTGLSTLYTGSGNIVPLVVTVPSGGNGQSAPTGLVFNGTGKFWVKSHDLSGSAFFVFDGEEGVISGWNPTVNLTHAITAVNNHDKGAVYKGLAIGTDSDGNSFLYATNFHSGWVEMYDSNFNWVKNFTDTTLPAGYAPFGARVLNGFLYVTFALQDADKHDDVAGPGHGFVDIFDLAGNMVKRLVSRGDLNSPWGLAWAPANFGKFSGDLLIGNFGNGHINAYDGTTGASKGHLLRQDGTTLVIDGLWGLHFGNDAAAGPSNVLLFSAGPEDESHGLFGSLSVAP